MSFWRSNQFVPWLALCVAAFSSAASAYQAYNAQRISSYPFLANLQSQQLNACAEYSFHINSYSLALNQMQRLKYAERQGEIISNDRMHRSFDRWADVNRQLILSSSKLMIFSTNEMSHQLSLFLEIQEKILEKIDNSNVSLENIDAAIAVKNASNVSIINSICRQIATGKSIGL
jgi:hypothetical protein